MAKARTTRLKVYGATIGFFDTVVAAPSQAGALKAWGVRQNLFAEGAAHPVEDATTVKTALAHPGEPLRRPVGTDKPFAVDAEAPPLPRSRRVLKPEPDRAKLDAAEAKLDRIEQDRRAEEAEFAEARTALEARIAEAREAYADRRKAAREAVAAARAAFRKAGGKL